MKILTVVMLLLTMLFVGCGVNKEYVNQAIADSEARTNAEIGTLKDKTDGNAAEIAKLRDLAAELDGKADMAINKAKGFENFQIIWQGEINFDFDSYAINGSAEAILNDAGDKMDSNPGSIIEIVGHTDQTGASTYNLMLGQQRASAAQRFLADRFGVSLYRMFILSHGENKPISAPGEMQSASKNRRVNLTIWGPMN